MDEIIALTADDPAPDFASSDTPFAFPDSQPPEPLVIPDLAPDSAVPSATDSPPSTNDLPDRGSPIPTFSIYPENTQFRESKTQLQQQTVQLVHVQTNAAIDLPLNLDLIHIGKPNERIPPGIDVSVFPNAEIVSRVHANIRLEGGHYFIEDVGSSNGTYINNIPLLPGNRHRLRSGDRIALGKGNLVTFLFQLN
ncbi:FHA domain-containing protein [Acaryochloris sp. IP29b_bin.148]|uniref:FHA domain-containing protein n=1 Tax=Acaryochloris sp. IP29b_bin.148 TaxID=2969218 RepID=UPI0034570EB6